MFCQKCGHENSDRALQCASCGEILVPVTKPPMDTLPPAPPEPAAEAPRDERFVRWQSSPSR